MAAGLRTDDFNCAAKMNCFWELTALTALTRLAFSSRPASEPGASNAAFSLPPPHARALAALFASKQAERGLDVSDDDEDGDEEQSWPSQDDAAMAGSQSPPRPIEGHAHDGAPGGGAGGSGMPNGAMLGGSDALGGAADGGGGAVPLDPFANLDLGALEALVDEIDEDEEMDEEDEEMEEMGEEDDAGWAAVPGMHRVTLPPEPHLHFMAAMPQLRVGHARMRACMHAGPAGSARHSRVATHCTLIARSPHLCIGVGAHVRVGVCGCVWSQRGVCQCPPVHTR